MKKLYYFLSFFLFAAPLHASEKEDNQVLVFCSKVNNEFLHDLNLNLTKGKSGNDNYALIVWGGNAEPYYNQGNPRATMPANLYIFNGKVKKFNASLTATVSEDLTITASVIRVFPGENEGWSRHGEFYAYNNSTGRYKSVDYISSLGRVYQLKSEPHRNNDCESKFPSLHIVTDNESDEG